MQGIEKLRNIKMLKKNIENLKKVKKRKKNIDNQKKQFGIEEIQDQRVQKKKLLIIIIDKV